MKNRKDKWTEEENTMLKKIVLEHLQIGATKTAAFKKASNVLGRTTAACRYRYNHVLCKEEKTPFPNTSQQLQLPSPKESSQETASVSLSLNDVIEYLQSLKTNASDDNSHKENKRLCSEQEELKKQSAALQKKYAEKKAIYQKLLTQYENFAKILDESEEMIKGHIVH